MQNRQLFIEILVEELPAIPFLREFENFDAKWQESLQKVQLSSHHTQFYYTPRRIVIFDPSFAPRAQDYVQENYGAPVSIAFEGGDKNGALKAPAEAFLKKYHLTREGLEFAYKDGKEVLFCSEVIRGAESEALLPLVVQDFLERLHFGKPMYWGEVKSSFIRPIRNVMIFLDSHFLKFSGYGIHGEPKTLLRTENGYEWKQVSGFCSYQEILESFDVLLSQKQRREKILHEIDCLQKAQNISVEVDLELLDEVVAITESPRTLLGSFDPKFLQLPKEMIITSMKENQRYFAVYQDESHQKLSHHFVMVSNATTSDQELILRGNEKVLRARLEDGMFFYHNDLKAGLRVEDLTKLGFIEGAGNMFDKTQRESKLALFLHAELGKFHKDFAALSGDEIKEAVWYSKADLLSEAVCEFSNLQGIMGDYYAKAMGKNEKIAQAIREQYLPLGESSELPQTPLGALLSLAYRLDSLMVLFNLQKIPTGSKDPFALRRAANGVIKIALHFWLDFHLETLLSELCALFGFQAELALKMREFFYERLEGVLDANPSVIKAVLCGEGGGICEIQKRVRVLQKVLALNELGSYTATFKRAANILKDVKKENLSIREELFKEPAERELFQAYQALRNKAGLYSSQGKIQDYPVYMDELRGIKIKLDDFFDQVLVNVEDRVLKNNRIALVHGIYSAFLRVADMKEISIQ